MSFWSLLLAVLLLGLTIGFREGVEIVECVLTWLGDRR